MYARWYNVALFSVAAFLGGCSGNGHVMQSIPPASVDHRDAVTRQPTTTSAAVNTDGPLMLTGASLERFLLPLRQSHPELRSLATYQAPITFTRLDVPGMPGFIYAPGGEIVPAHESDEDQSVIEHPADSKFPCSAKQAETWNGNTPPACTNSGALRRVYTSPGLDALESFVTLPGGGQTLPTNPKTYPTGDTGFVYLEGWPGRNAQNAEADLQYSQKNTWYSFIVKDGTGNEYGPLTPFVQAEYVIIIEADQDATVEVNGTTTSCSTGCFAAGIVWTDPNGQQCPGGKVCAAAGVLHNKLWTWNCCIFAHVASIGQKLAAPNNFEDGSKFGTVSWANDMTGKYEPLAGYPGVYAIQTTTPSFLEAGSQSWPNDPTRVLVSGNESDSISLHK